MFLILITDLKHLLQNWGGQSQSPCCGLEVAFKAFMHDILAIFTMA